MFSYFQLSLSVILTSLVTLGLLALYMRRTIPKILQDVGADIGEQFKEIFVDPNVSRAMSIIGKKSGQVRHDAAAENALAEGLLNNVAPEIRMILDKIDPELINKYGPETILGLAAKYGPLIQRFLPGGLGSLGNMLGNTQTKKLSDYGEDFNK